MSGTPAAAAAPLPRHSLLDDLQALFTGTLFVALGLVLFRQAGLATGGTVGLAFIAHYALHIPFGAALFVVNLPFYALAWRRMGKRFTLKTVAAVGLLSLLSEALPRWLRVAEVAPWFAALAGGLLVGAGFIMLFRHKASLGGLNVLVLWLQQRFGWPAGWLQLALDATILAAASPWLSWSQLGLSVGAAVAMNAALALNHKPGRYVAVAW